MVKALQACDLKDMWKPAASILKSLARDPETSRTRDAKEGEETLWDLIQRSKSHFIDTKTQTIAEDQHEDIFYSEADALEDCILFPVDNQESALFKPNSNAIDKLLGKVPNMMRFIQDLDTDEEASSSDEDDDVRDLTTDGQGFQSHQSVRIFGPLIAPSPLFSSCETCLVKPLLGKCVLQLNAYPTLEMLTPTSTTVWIGRRGRRAQLDIIG